MENVGNYYLKDIIGQNGVSQIKGIPSLSQQNKAEEFMSDTPFKKNYQTGPLVGGFYEGASKYDENIGSVERMITEGMTTDETRAEMQSTLNRIGNALFNNAVIAGTTAVSGTLGFAVGIVDALANEELNKLYDNPVNRKMVQLQEEAAKIAPNYYTKDYEESSIWKKLGTSIFWADLIKNLGYAEGMMIPGTGVSKLLQGVPKAAQIIGSSLYSSISEASIEALNAKQDKTNYESNIAYDSYLKDINRGENSNVAKEKYINALSSIEDGANNAGNFVLGYNVALLTLTNSLEWGKLFSRGNTFSRRKMLEQARKEGIDVVNEGVLPTLKADSNLKHTVKNIATRLGKSSLEGIEEVMQGVGVSAADLNPKYNEFNEHVYNQDYRELASGMISSVGMALSEAMKDPETYTNFAMGFFTGALGVPTLQNPKTNDGYRSPIVLEGGLKEFLEEQRDHVKKTQFVNDVNSRIEQNGSIEEYYKGLVRNTLLEDKANVALELNDVFNFNNAKHSQLISDVIMFDNVGHIDVLQDIINKSTNFTDEEIQELISQGLFENNGNKVSIEDAKSKIQNNVDNLNTVLTNYLNDKALIESQKGDELSKDAMENILYAKSQINNWLEREENIIKEILEHHPNVNLEIADESSFIELLKTSSNFRNQLKDKNNNTLTADIAEDLNRKIDDVARIENAIKEFTNKINEYWEYPNKANEAVNKIKQQAVKSIKDKKIKSLKDKISSIQSVGELRSFIENSKENSINDALKDLSKENNTIVAEYNKINSETSNIESKIRESEEDQQSIQDALLLLNKASKSVESASQLKDLQSELYNDINLLEEEDLTLANERMTKARVVLQKALEDSSSETNDTNSTIPGLVIPDSIENASFEGFDESPADVGNSGVSKAQPVNSTEVKELETAEIKDSDTIPADNSTIEDIKKDVEFDVDYLTDRDEDYWNPAISEYHRSSLKEGKYVSLAKGDSRFKDVWKYLFDRNAFDFVNRGNLKTGDTLYFGLALDDDSKWVKDSVFVYVKTDVGHQVLNTLYLSGEELKLKDKILEEYDNSEKQENQKHFISSYTSKVQELKTGVIVQDSTLRSLNISMEGTDINPNNIVLSVIRGVKKETGNFNSKNEVSLPIDIGNKNGWTYIEIPNVKRGSVGGRTAMPLFVADYGKQTSSSFENTQIYKRIQNAIRAIATASNIEELKQGFSKLQKDLTTKKLSLFLTPEGHLRINERVFDSAGKPVKEEKNGKLVEVQIPHTIFKTTRDGSPKTIEAIVEEIDNLLKSMNIRFRTNAQYINTSNYNKELIESGILSSYLVKTEERNAWFTIEPVDLEAPQKEEIVEEISRPTNIDERIVIRSSIAGEGEVDFTPREFKRKTNNVWNYSGDARDLDPSRTGIKYHPPRENKGSVSHITWFPETSFRSGGATFSFYKPLTQEEVNVVKNIIETDTSNNIKEMQTLIDNALFLGKTKTHTIEHYQTHLESSDLDLDDLMSDFGGEITANTAPDKEYSSRVYDTKSANNIDVSPLLNNGYSQEDINSMSPEELQQAKKCLGF